jgi:hypothetical protein
MEDNDFKNKIWPYFMLLVCLGCFKTTYPFQYQPFEDKDFWKREWVSKVTFDSTCFNVKRPSNKTHIKIWGQTISLNGSFKLRHKNYGIIGHLKNGVPVGEWFYIKFPYFAALHESFKCGHQTSMGSSPGGVAEQKWISKEFGVDVSTIKHSKITHVYIQHQIAKGIRNKIHRKIYNSQK